MEKYFPEHYTITIPIWSEKHKDERSFVKKPLIGVDGENFYTTIRTCGKDIASSYQNVTLIEKITNTPLARMDTGTTPHFNRHSLDCVDGPHVHIYDEHVEEKSYSIEELLGIQTSQTAYIKAFWEHFNVDTKGIDIQGDLFDGTNN